jgi:hypothetical protein
MTASGGTSDERRGMRLGGLARGRWRRAVSGSRWPARGVAGPAEVVEDAVDHGALRDERHDPHRGPALGTPERIDLEDLPQQLGPAPARLAQRERHRNRDANRRGVRRRRVRTPRTRLA